MKRLALCASSVVIAIALSVTASAQSDVKKVIFDQDADGIIGGNLDPLIMLLQADNVQVLGVTVATGNGWLKQETADTLKLLEVLGREDIPVYMGAEFPLLQTREELWLLTKLYGGHRLDPFLGAYAENNPGPDHVVPPPGGFAKRKPEAGHAAEFIIRSIRSNPNQVTLYVGGPLTNVALAIRLAPDIVPLTKELVFMGTSPHHHSKTVNVIYDPEAAKIALRAAWPKLTLVTVDVAEKVHQSPELVEQIVKGRNQPVADLYRTRVWEPYQKDRDRAWFRMPDEVQAAYIIDPSLFTETRRMYVDINTIHGPDYAGSMFWDEEPRGYGGRPWRDGPRAQKPVPSPNARVAHVLWDFDVERFKRLYVDLMTRPGKTR